MRKIHIIHLPQQEKICLIALSAAEKGAVALTGLGG